ncbi:hypothetical protein GCM10027298_34760 [Epidermidibacterium keratini]
MGAEVSIEAGILAGVPAILIAAIDAVVILVFAATGRSSHSEGLSAGGVLQTAWPFLVGAAVGWLIAYAVRRRAPRTLPDGILVWASTLVVGMILRQLSGSGTAVSFVIVAAIVLALLLVGWRAVAVLVRRRRSIS